MFIDENKLELKAVIRNDSEQLKEWYALLLVQNVKTGVENIEKYKQGSLVHGYQLKIEKNTQVILTKKNEQSLQRVVLKMYGAR